MVAQRPPSSLPCPTPIGDPTMLSGTTQCRHAGGAAELTSLQMVRGPWRSGRKERRWRQALCGMRLCAATVLTLMVITTSGCVRAHEVRVSSSCQAAWCVSPCSTQLAGLPRQGQHRRGPRLYGRPADAPSCMLCIASREHSRAYVRASGVFPHSLARMQSSLQPPGTCWARRPRTLRPRSTSAGSRSQPQMPGTAHTCSERSSAAAVTLGGSRCAAVTRRRQPAAPAWQRSSAAAAVRCAKAAVSLCVSP